MTGPPWIRLQNRRTLLVFAAQVHLLYNTISHFSLYTSHRYNNTSHFQSLAANVNLLPCRTRPDQRQQNSDRQVGRSRYVSDRPRRNCRVVCTALVGVVMRSDSALEAITSPPEPTTATSPLGTVVRRAGTAADVRRSGGPRTAADCPLWGWGPGFRMSRSPTGRRRPRYRCPVWASPNHPRDWTDRWTCTPVPGFPCPFDQDRLRRGFSGSSVLATCGRRRRTKVEVVFGVPLPTRCTTPTTI